MTVDRAAYMVQYRARLAAARKCVVCCRELPTRGWRPRRCPVCLDRDRDKARMRRRARGVAVRDEVRRCTVCRIAGHTRATCPDLA